MDTEDLKGNQLLIKLLGPDQGGAARLHLDMCRVHLHATRQTIPVQLRS